MTPQEHLRRAEAFIAAVDSPDILFTDASYMPALASALAHAIVALAAELGVPHSAVPQGGEAGGQAR